MRSGTYPVEFDRTGARAAHHYMDATRFAAALAVVVGHAVGMVWGRPAGGVHDPWVWVVMQMASFGHHAVMVFFVLSGFWVTHSAMRRLSDDGFWPEFLTDRLTRLHIVIVPALAIGGLLDLLGARLFHGAVYWGGLGFVHLADGVYSHLTPAAFAGSLLFLQGFAVVPVGTNLALWSVAFEFWYYVWFAALAVSFRRRRPSLALLTLLLGAIWPVLLLMFPVWLMGSLVYLADRRQAERPAATPREARRILAAGALAMALALGLSRTGALKTAVSDLLVGLAFSLLLWGLLRDAIGFPRWLAPVARYGATASYSLYVIHYPLFAFVLSAIGHGARREPDLASLAIIVTLSILAVAAGWLFSRATEVHTFRLRRMIRCRLRPATRG